MIVSSAILAAILSLAVGVSLFQDSPGELAKRFLAAQRQMTNGDFEGAVASYRRLVGTPANPLLRPRRVLVRVGDEVVPLTAAATYQIASSFRRRGEEALAAGETAAEPAAHEDLARASREYRALCEDASAPGTLRERAAFQVGDCLFKGAAYAEAVAAFEEFRRAFPQSRYEGEARYRTAWARYNTGEWGIAADLFMQVAAADTDAERSTRSLFQAGEAYERLGENSEALRCFLALTNQFDPRPYEGKRRVREVIHLLRENLSATTRELVGKAHVRIGDQYARLDSLDTALRWYDLAASRFPTEPDVVRTAYLRRAEILLAADRQPEVLTAYRQALEAVSDPLFRAEVQVRLMSLLRETGQHLEAAAAYGFYAEAFAPQAAAAGVTVPQALLLRAESLRLAAGEDHSGAVRDSLYQASRAEYENLLATTPQDSLKAEALLGTAICDEGLGDIGAALERLEQLVAEYGPTRTGQWGLLLAARYCAAAGDTTQAVTRYVKLTAVDAGDAGDVVDQGRIELTLLYEGQGRSADAVAQLVAVDTSSTEFGRAQVLLVDLYGQQGDWERAEQVLQRLAARQIEPRTAVELAYTRARMAFQRHEFDGTLALLADVDTTYLTDVAAVEWRYLRGASRYETGRYAEAADDLEGYLASGFDLDWRGPAVQLLARCLAAQGDREEAARRLQARREQSASAEQRGEWQLALARMWCEAGDYLRAVEALQEEDGDRQIAAEARLLLAEAYLGLGEWDQALKALADSEPGALTTAQTERRLLLQGVASMNAGQYPGAVAFLEELLGRPPGEAVDSAARLHLGQCLYALGRNDEAVAVLRDLVTRYPDTPNAVEAAFLTGENLYLLGRYGDATAAYQQVTAGPRRPAASLAVAWCYIGTDQPTELVLQQLEALQSQYPDVPEARQAAV
ncbi:MAG: tetratricopeptide repeat protein, partial [Candidatus Latescibacterota bacterium]